MNNFFLQTAISRDLRDLDTNSGSEIEDFCENLIVIPFLSKSLPPGGQEKVKMLGGRSAPPPLGVKRSKKCWVYRVINLTLLTHFHKFAKSMGPNASGAQWAKIAIFGSY